MTPRAPENLEPETAQADLAADLVAATTEAVAEAQRLGVENALLHAALENARESNEAMLHRAETAEADLSEEMYNHGYDDEVNRRLVLELLSMLGKKARRRNKKRLREIRLAIAEDVPGDDEVVS